RPGGEPDRHGGLAAEPLSPACPRLGCFFLTAPRRGIRLERFQETSRDRRDLVDGREERGLVGLRRLVEAADLSYELQRGRADLFVGHRRLEVEQGLDVSTHD